MTLNKGRKRPRKANVYKILVTDVFLCPTKSMLPSCSTLTGPVEHSATMLSISDTLTLNPSSRQRTISSSSVRSIYTIFMLKAQWTLRTGLSISSALTLNLSSRQMSSKTSSRPLAWKTMMGLQ